MDLPAIIAGVGAILTATGGTLLVVHEFRRRDHAAASDQLAVLAEELAACREERVKANQMMFVMRQRLADHGIEVPQAGER